MFKNLREQIPATVKLAIPITFTQMGQMLMGLVDIFMVGKLGAKAIGAVAVGGALFFTVFVFGTGLLSSLDYFISKSRGEGNFNEVRIWKIHGLYFSIMASVPLTILILICSAHLNIFGVPTEIATQTHEFLKIYCWSLPPLMIFFSQRQYLQSTGSAKSVTIMIILANILNFTLNWLLVTGHWGFPSLGIRGSAISTVTTRTLLAASVFYFAFYKDKKFFEKINLYHLKELSRLGFPGALQGTFEVAIFSLSTAFASQLDPSSLAAHSIVLNIASFTFMIPVGLSFAAAIRVGYFLGEKDYKRAQSAGYSALFLSASFMAFSGLTMFLGGTQLIGIFTDDSAVIEIAKKIIILAAIFQVADGIQAVATGSMRGLGNTKASAIANLLCYWLVALPIGYYLCFKMGLGLVGLWIGLTVGLVLVASSLLVIWQKFSNNRIEKKAVLS